MPVGVEESDGFAGGAVFGVEVGEDFGKCAAGEVGKLGAFGELKFCQRRFHLNFIVTERKQEARAAEPQRQGSKEAGKEAKSEGARQASPSGKREQALAFHMGAQRAGILRKS